MFLWLSDNAFFRWFICGFGQLGLTQIGDKAAKRDLDISSRGNLAIASSSAAAAAG